MMNILHVFDEQLSSLLPSMIRVLGEVICIRVAAMKTFDALNQQQWLAFRVTMR
jgi:hypothetical protein